MYGTLRHGRDLTPGQPISDMPVNVHTDYTDFTVDSKTIHRLDESGTGWTAFSEYEDPYKNSNNIFKSS